MLSAGHREITSAALDRLGSSCPEIIGFCADLGRKVSRTEFDRFKSKSEFKLSKVQAISNDTLLKVASSEKGEVPIYDLALEVLGLDFGPNFWTHTHPDGQKYHFMRHSNQTNEQAYLGSVEFLRFHVVSWIKESRAQYLRASTTLADLGKNRISPTSSSVAMSVEEYRKGNERAKKFLAIALHCLQDSFSPGHVLRSEKQPADHLLGTEQPSDADGLALSSAAKIWKLYDYSKQGDVHHSLCDLKSGVIMEGWGKQAVEASLDLLTKGSSAIIQGPTQFNWEQFRETWLAIGNFQAIAPAEKRFSESSAQKRVQRLDRLPKW